jgi:preprotein translocase subunit SecG
MYKIALYVHIGISLLLVVTILIQRGRGGGLVEALAGAESLFGTKTSSFLVRSTTILAILFFVTSTGLAFLSKQRGRSIFETKPQAAQQLPRDIVDQVTEEVEEGLDELQEDLKETVDQETVEKKTQDAPENLPDAQ